MRIRTISVSILAIALFAWFLRHANLGDVWEHVRRARLDLLLAGLGTIFLTYAMRAWRWQYLLAPIGPTRFRTAFRTTIIGFAALGVLPARAGDILRPYLLAKQEGLSTSATFATIVMERVLDLIAVLALLALYVWGIANADSLPASVMRPIEISAAVAVRRGDCADGGDVGPGDSPGTYRPRGVPCGSCVAARDGRPIGRPRSDLQQRVRCRP